MAAAPAVKDAGEVHVKDHVRKVGDHSLSFAFSVAVAAELTHQLKEQGTVILLVFCAGDHTVIRCSTVQLKCVYTIFLSGIAHKRSG